MLPVEQVLGSIPKQKLAHTNNLRRTNAQNAEKDATARGRSHTPDPGRSGAAPRPQRRLQPVSCWTTHLPRRFPPAPLLAGASAPALRHPHRVARRFDGAPATRGGQHHTCGGAAFPCRLAIRHRLRAGMPPLSTLFNLPSIFMSNVRHFLLSYNFEGRRKLLAVGIFILMIYIFPRAA
jgi:hypothetical protein